MLIPRGLFRRTGSLLAASLTIGIVLAPTSAMAQCAVCDQYVPPGHHASGSPGEPPAPGAPAGTNSSGAGDAPAGQQPSGGSLASPSPASSERGGGSVPILDYPATPLLWIMLIAIGSMLALSLGALGRRRLRDRRTSAL